MMQRVAALSLIVALGCAEPALAQQLTADQETRIKLGIDLIKLGCGTRSTREKTEVSGTGDLSLTLKKLPGATVGGKLNYSTEEAQGLASALQKEITAEGTKITLSQLDCMKPYIQRIFDVIFPKPPQQPVVIRPPNPTPPPIRPLTGEWHFVGKSERLLIEGTQQDSTLMVSWDNGYGRLYAQGTG